MGRHTDTWAIRVAILMFIAAAVFHPLAFVAAGTLLVLGTLVLRRGRKV